MQCTSTGRQSYQIKTAKESNAQVWWHDKLQFKQNNKYTSHKVTKPNYLKHNYAIRYVTHVTSCSSALFWGIIMPCIASEMFITVYWV